MKTLVRSVFLIMMLTAASSVQATAVEELFGATTIDNLRDVRRLLQDRVVDPKALDPHGETVLIVAIRNDATRVIDYLLADKATELDATNVSGETAMMIAAYRNQKDTVEKLIARGAEVNRGGWTALHYAASVDARDIVALLLEHAAYVDAESPNKTTPLMMAARGNFGELCHQLVDAGADPTPVNERDRTASDFAKQAGNLELSQWLDTQVVAWRAKYGASPSRQPPGRH
jgi:ankyrin repeat protein